MGDKGKFDPNKHIIYLKNKAYLETKFRILWYREDHPNGAIQTELLSYEPMVIKATVYDGNGAVLATGHAGAVDKGNAVWSGKSLEKAESAAIGRALGHAGYGTQFIGAEDAGLRRDANGNWRDEQRERVNNQQRPNPPAKSPPASKPAANGNGSPWSEAEAKAFVSKYVSDGIPPDILLTILNVKRWGEWTKTRKDADEAVEAWRKRQAEAA